MYSVLSLDSASVEESSDGAKNRFSIVVHAVTGVSRVAIIHGCHRQKSGLEAVGRSHFDLFKNLPVGPGHNLICFAGDCLKANEVFL